MMPTAWLLALFLAGLPKGQGPLEPVPPGFLEGARQTALSYSRQLPDFLCTETVRRSQAYGPTGDFRNIDALTLQVSYFQLHESYKLVARNNHPTQPNVEALAGAYSEGEFGSKLRFIFDPESKTEFHFLEEKSVAGRRAAVYSYRVERANSRFELRVPSQSVIAGYHGQVFIDVATQVTLRIEEVLDIPEGFPIQESRSTVEYGFVDVAGRKSLLPVHSETLSTDRLEPRPEAKPSSPSTILHPWDKPAYPATGRTGRASSANSPQADQVRYRNLIEFRNYRKYAADSSLTFDTPVNPPK